MHKHTKVSALLNAFVVIATFVAWFAAIDGTVTALNLASLLGALALGLMWVHYVADVVAPRDHAADVARDYQYVVSRGVVLVAILLHPLLINWYLLDNDFGFPPSSYEQLLGTAAWAVSLGWIALIAFIAFEIRKKLPNYRRHIFHANIIAMLLVLIHGFSVGLVLMTSWYVWIWWLLLVSFIAVAVIRYRKYYGDTNPARLRIALFGIAVLSLAAGISGVRAVQAMSPLTDEVDYVQTESPAVTVSLAELSAKDGLNDRECWVAIDGLVYDATSNPQWENGVHTPSGGRAACGNDLSSDLDMSPHGRSVLSQLPVVAEIR